VGFSVYPATKGDLVQADLSSRSGAVVKLICPLQKRQCRPIVLPPPTLDPLFDEVVLGRITSEDNSDMPGPYDQRHHQKTPPPLHLLFT
jgi:hypothetical protein